MDRKYTTIIASLELKSSWHARAIVNGIPVILLVDSGAGTTIVDSSILRKIGLNESDLSADSETYRTANGEVFRSLGKAEVTLVVDSVETTRTVVFANLGSEYGLLGMDYLEHYDCVLHFSSGQLQVAGHEVQLHKPSKLPGCRVSLIDDTQP